ncbi:expressed unknown protein [Seminavis robusta]|uniref:Uncharacterized protein n=1 Tax=Seminavis robusta TaxID=568900 RepID=A0A9N8HWR4_9STRA|nr:expressed unknown protein [Seminavis robusta]|eukprot:Sro2285_g321930.1 n/a (146) ;mRNA; r:2076-2513
MRTERALEAASRERSQAQMDKTTLLDKSAAFVRGLEGQAEDMRRVISENMETKMAKTTQEHMQGEVTWDKWAYTGSMMEISNTKALLKIVQDKIANPFACLTLGGLQENIAEANRKIATAKATQPELEAQKEVKETIAAIEGDSP